MRGLLFAGLFAALILSACVVAPGHPGPPGPGVVVVPPLPSVVVFEAEPYYYHGGYHYHYVGGVWYYSSSSSGPWVDLPRGHYPKEIRYKGAGPPSDRGKGKGRGRGWKRGHDD